MQLLIWVQALFFASNNPAEAPSCKSQDSLIKFIDSIDEGFELLELIFDKQGNVLDFVFLKVNPPYERQTGLKAANIIGKRKKENAPAREQRWYDYAIQAVKTGKTLQYDYYNDKVNRYFDTQFIPISTNQIAVMFKDITERKKTEEALKQSEIKFRTVADFTYDWEHWISPEGTLIYVSPSCERITGFKPEEFIEDQDLIIKIVHPDDKALIEHHYKSIDSKELPDVDYRIITKSGEVRWIAHGCQPVFDGKGTWLGRRGSNRDITERKKAEEALKESEERFQSLFEQSPTAFEIYDKNGLQIQTNHAWEKMWNVPREYTNEKFNIFESKQIAEMGLLPYVKRAYAGETVLVPETPFDASLEPQTLGEGRKRWLRSIYYPIINVHGEVINIVVMHEDVTEKKNLEKQLQDNERMAAIGQTAGMIGHDIRNPLQAIVSELYLAKGSYGASTRR